MPPANANPADFRLPLDVKPTHYDVSVRTDLEKLTFDGFVTIDLDVKKETSNIVFNSADLNLGSASIHSDALQTQQVDSSRTYDKKQERTTLHFAKPLPAGSKANLKISFDGTLTGNMMGYYRSSYEVEGVKKYYTLTQFEPTAARRAFPCWDEPLLKATFAVTMISRADLVNLSNMPVTSEKLYVADSPKESGGAVSTLTNWMSSLSFGEQTSKDKWKVTKFETTPPMSTYLVAYANGHFEYLESSYVSPLSGKTRPLRVYATADLIEQAQFGLDVKAKVMPLYEKVFDVEYPLPKLDTLIATDFDAGAMENWGLITGRTSAYLLDPKRADIQAKKRIATTQSHEVAHQWFGNITTMEWWDNLYLNEGFATLMGEVVIAVFPEWKVNSNFIEEHLNSALSLDAKLSSHPIEVECPDANQINQIFDALSYSKAASVLRMLSNYVGEDKFLKGVSIYLKNHLYANSVSNDLWDGISEATGKPVTEMMQTWVGKMGFPVLTVTETPKGIEVRQDRFLETGLAQPDDNKTIWTIPISLLTVSKDGKPSIDKQAILDTREKTIELDTSKPFKLNANTTGVYRVLYSPERLAKIAEEAAKVDTVFSLDDRIGLVHDTMALSQAGLAKVSGALDLVNTLRNEKEYLVWDSISGKLSGLTSIWFENESVIDGLNAFRRALFVPLVKNLGYEYPENEDPDTSMLRTAAISAAVSAKDPSAVEELRKRFAEFSRTGDDSIIPADLVRTTYAAAVRYGGREEYDAMKKIHESPKNPTSRQAAILAMGAHPDPALARETLEYALAKAREQDLIYFFRGVAYNSKTRRELTTFFKNNYDTLYKKFEGNFSLKYFVETCFDSLTTEKDYQETAAFFKDKDTGKYKLALEQTLDTIRSNAAWIERSTDDIANWLEKWEKSTKS